MTELSRGILLFAENNKNVNYVKLAILAAQCIKNNMGKDTKVSIVTNKYSLNWFSEDMKQYISALFDKVILIGNSCDTGESLDNIRVYRDTRYHSVNALFLNKSRSSAYSLSPYDETILMDVDYFVLNDSLNKVWGIAEDVLINKSAKSLQHKDLAGPEFRLNPYGIRMYWATLIYFKKSEKAKLLFDLVEHVKEAWHYYKHVYDFPGDLFRNDFAFSIALHMLNGFVDDNGLVKSFPDESILTAVDTDQFRDFENKNTVVFLTNDLVENYKFYFSKVKSVNVHSLNKLAILNKFDELFEKLK